MTRIVPSTPDRGISMKRFPKFLPLLLILSACATPGSDLEPSPGPLEWPEGQFTLQGTAQYSHQAGLLQSTITAVHWLNLTIDPGGSMRVESSAGFCREPEEPVVQQQLARGYRSFPCGNVRFTVRPAGSTLRGEMTVSYTQSVRVRGGCAVRDENGVCLEYEYNIEDRPRSQRVSLRVQAKG